MTSPRAILAFVLLAVVALAVTVSATDLITGSMGPGDYQVHREAVKKPSKWLQVVEADRTFNTDNGRTISQVRLYDQNKKGNGATPSITAGGPGFTYVTVHFKSKRGHSIDFVAELYGR